MSRGMSSSGLKFKKSAVSAFCSKFIEVFIIEDDENYKTFRNFTTGTIDIPKNQVYEKIPISEDEYNLIMKTLEEDENYLGMAWVAVMYNAGCRRNECRKFKSEIVNYDPKGKNYIVTHQILGKGRGGGKPLKYMIPLTVIPYIKKWLDVRGYEHEYIFTTKYNGKINQMSKDWADDFCSNVLSDIVGRRINPHLFKGSCISNLLEKGVSMKAVSKYIGHHEQVTTTQAHYDLRIDDDEMDNIF